QAEVGIGSRIGTGVQTCALPILLCQLETKPGRRRRPVSAASVTRDARKPCAWTTSASKVVMSRRRRRAVTTSRGDTVVLISSGRSEERRVGDEWLERWSRTDDRK